MTPALMRLMKRMMDGEIVRIQYQPSPNSTTTFELALANYHIDQPVLRKRYISKKGNVSNWKSVETTTIDALMEFAEYQVDSDTATSEEPTDGRHIEL